MKRVNIFCEGPTEETFVNRILKSSFATKEVYLKAIPVRGVSKYSILKKRISDLCKNDKEAVVTTMLDYYGIPFETPGIKESQGISDIYEKIQYIEGCIGNDIGMKNFIPHLMLHEFETLLFSKPECFADCRNISAKMIDNLCRIKEEYQNPEKINNSPETAPSKRILKIYPQYDKVIDGTNIAMNIGLYTMRQECRHFNSWIDKLESLHGE